MAEFAPVAPPKLLLDLKKKGALGKYHLLLAHDIVAQESLYREIFDDVDDSWYIIMDNSLIELGYPVNVDTMEKACSVVHTDVVVLPDYMKDPQRTAAASMSALVKWGDAGLGPFMYVLQADRDGVDWSQSGVFLSHPKVTAVGIPRIHVEQFGSRLSTLWELSVQLTGLSRGDMDCHMLGFSDDLLDDITCCRLPCIRGIDSAVPIRLGIGGDAINLMEKSHAPRGDFWDHATKANALAYDNLRVVREWISSS